MRKRIWIALLLGALVVLVGFASWRLLPTGIEALPGQIRARIPEEVMAYVATPLPTALPKPIAALPDRQVEVIIPTLEPNYEPTVEKAKIQTAKEQKEEPSPVITSLPTVLPLTSTPTPEPTITATPLPSQSLVEGLQIMPQKFNNCGPANLTMVLNFYQQEIDQLQVGGQLKPNYDDRNVSPEEMVHYVNNQSDLAAHNFVGGDLEILKKLIVNGFPVIVEKGLVLTEYQGWMGHYLTVYGFDDLNQEFMTKDSFLGPWDNSGRKESYDKLEELWEQFNYAFIVIFRESDAERIAEILGEQMMESDQMWHRAAQTAQTKATEEPENAFAWFNLGQSLVYVAKLTGDLSLYPSAAAAFDKAREIGLPWRTLWYRFEPYQAYLAAGRADEVLSLTEVMINSLGGGVVEETYFYRGQALAAAGRDKEAAQALDRAKALNPNHSQISSYELPININDG